MKFILYFCKQKRKGDMANFWLSKKNIIEALKMSEGMPQNTKICFHGDSEKVDDVVYTKTTIEVGGKSKTFKEKFEPDLL